MSDNLSFLLTCAAECLNNWGYDGHGKHVDDGVKEITRLRAENEKLRAALISCAIDLEVEINARYRDCNGKVHPALQRKYDNDMSTVRAAAAALEDN